MGLTNNLGKLSNMITSTGSAVGIGTSSPSYTLDVTGTGTFRAANGVNIIGPTGNPAYLTTDQSVNNGGKRWRIGHTGAASGWSSFDIYNQTDNILGMTITSTGLVGIGTSSPVNTFQIGSVTYSGNELAIGNGSAQFAIDMTSTNTDMYSSGTLTFNTALSERMRIDTSGNVGISTSTPYAPLQVNGNIHRAWTSAGTTGSPASQEGFVYSEQSNANALAGMWFENNFQSGSAVSVVFKYRTNGASVTEGIRLTSTGDTEFQGTNSSAKFKFWNNYSNSQPGIAVYNTSGTEIFSFNGNTSGLSISGYVSTPIYYGTANSASLAANSTTSYSQWQVSGSRSGYGGFVDTYSGMAVMHDSGGSGGFYRQASGKWTIYWSAGNNCVGIGNSTTVNWAAACTNGTMFYTSESYATYDMYARSFIPTSDIRLKENIVPLESSLDKIKQLEGVSYNRIEDIEKKREIGFIAQSVQQVIPEIVNYHEDTDTYGVDYDKITVLLTEALKEEDRKVLSLEAKIQEIETRLANL